MFVTIISDRRASFAKDTSGEIQKRRKKARVNFKCLKLRKIPDFLKERRLHFRLNKSSELRIVANS